MAEQAKDGEIKFPKEDKLASLIKDREEIKERLDQGKKDELGAKIKV